MRDDFLSFIFQPSYQPNVKFMSFTMYRNHTIPSFPEEVIELYIHRDSSFSPSLPLN